jgi:hypothetical protein
VANPYKHSARRKSGAEWKGGDPERIHDALIYLRKARDLLKEAGALRTYHRVLKAITSAGGAQRHAELWINAIEREKEADNGK